MNINALKFKVLLSKKKYTQKSLSDKLGIPTTSINAWVNRESIPEKHIKTLNEVLEIDLEDYFKESEIDLTDELSSGSAPIPYYGDLDISAGALSFWNDSSYREPTAKYMLPDSNADFILPVVGNSMSPNIDSGDKIAVKELVDTSVIFYGAVYVVITEDYRFVKVVRRHAEDNKVILQSYNPEFDDIDLPKKKIIKMFTVQEVLKKIQ